MEQIHKNVVTKGNNGWPKVEMQKNTRQYRKTPSHTWWNFEATFYYLRKAKKIEVGRVAQSV